MNKETKDILFKILLVVLLILAFTILIIEFRKIDKAGNECIQEPFIYGSKLMVDKGMSIYNQAYIHKSNTYNLYCVVK